MSIPKPTIYIIKGTDNVAEFRQNGISGWYEGNTNIDHRIDQNAFELRGLFINPSAFQHMDKLLAQSNGLLFNSITDADINPLCLANLNKALKSNPRPVINHPRLVMQTRRGEVARKLAGMDGDPRQDAYSIDKETAPDGAVSPPKCRALATPN